MRRASYILPGVVVALLGVVVAAATARAESLKIAPLEYRASLQAGEKKKGYVDVSNPSNETVVLAFEVQAFRQIDDNGGIEFYDDSTVSRGVVLDLESAELAPYEVLRLFFVIDGTKLPKGEIFAAVLAHTVPRGEAAAAQSVRVGTILELTHGGAGTHRASVDGFEAPFFQVGEAVTAQFVVRNEDKASQPTAFRPTVKVNIRPYSSKESEGPLVFAGHSRTVSYRVPGNYFGLVWLEAHVQSSSMGQWAFVMTGYWRWLGPLMIAAVTGLIGMALYTRSKKH